VKREAEEGDVDVVPRKTHITLKAEISTLLNEGSVGSRILVLDDKEVVVLLKELIKQEGSITGFAKRHSIERVYLSNL